VKRCKAERSCKQAAMHSWAQHCVCVCVCVCVCSSGTRRLPQQHVCPIAAVRCSCCCRGSPCCPLSSSACSACRWYRGSFCLRGTYCPCTVVRCMTRRPTCGARRQEGSGRLVQLEGITAGGHQRAAARAAADKSASISAIGSRSADMVLAAPCLLPAVCSCCLTPHT